MKSIIFTHSSNRSYLTARPSSLPLALTKAATLYPSLLPSSISLHLRLDTGLEVQVLEDAWDSEGLERDQMQFTVRGEERGGNQSLGEGTSKRGREEEEEEENEKLPKEEGERAVKKGREEAPGWKGKGKGREGGEAGTPDEGEGEEDPRATTVTLREPGCEVSRFSAGVRGGGRKEVLLVLVCEERESSRVELCRASSSLAFRTRAPSKCLEEVVARILAPSPLSRSRRPLLY